MCAAIIRTVRRGAPGAPLDHSSAGRFSIRYIVTRLFVRQAAMSDRPVSGPSLLTFGPVGDLLSLIEPRPGGAADHPRASLTSPARRQVKGDARGPTQTRSRRAAGRGRPGP